MPRQQSPKSLIDEARETLTFEDARFDHIGCTPAGDPLPTSEREVNDFIRRRTAVYLDTWVRPILKQASDKLTRLRAR